MAGRATGRIRDEDVLLVKERANIADVIGEHVTLRPAGGGNLKGLCPFHDEKTPSFSVRPSVGAYHCFGCQRGGDVISFVMEIDALPFADAVERLAERAGVQLRYADSGPAGRQPGQRARLVDAHRAAAQFYAEQLAGPEAAVGRRFLEERGFDQAAAERFGVGYAPRIWDALARHLRGRGFSDTELLAGGLASQGQRGLLDRFRGRLVWPIRDLSGDVVGFGARRLSDEDTGPKYLNTPETPLYRKSSVLYGLDLARREIAGRMQAVVVEGYTDVMACHLAGVGTAVATCGTAFGEEHIKVLRRLLGDQNEFRGEVVFTFDGDEAGQKAALRAFADDQKFVAQTYVAVEPGGLDPCDLRRRGGDAAVRDLVESRVPLFEFAIRSTIARQDLDTAEGRTAAREEGMAVVRGIKSVALRQDYARQLAGWIGLPDPDELVAQARGGLGSVGRRQGSAAAPGDPAQVRQRLALAAALQSPEVVGAAFDALPEDAFASDPYRTVRDAIAAAGGAAAATAGPAWITRVQEQAGEDRVRSLVSALAVEPIPSQQQSYERTVTDILVQLEAQAVEAAKTELLGRLQRLDPLSQADEQQQVQVRLEALERRRRAIREASLG